MAISDRAALEDAAEVIARRARLISGTFSRRIPANTSVGTESGFVIVRTDNVAAPNAAPFEFAELHPLWAKVGSYRYLHEEWGKQPHRPYMLMAAEQAAQDAAEVYGREIIPLAKSVFRSYGIATT